MNPEAIFQRLFGVNKYASKDYGVIEYADSEYDIFINVICIYSCCLQRKVNKSHNGRINLLTKTIWGN